MEGGLAYIEVGRCKCRVNHVILYLFTFINSWKIYFA
jgi:hypothetical protein